MIKKFITRMQLKLILRWAKKFDLHVVRIEHVGDTEYLTDKNGVRRTLVRPNVKAKAAKK